MFDTNKVVEGLNPTQGLKVGGGMTCHNFFSPLPCSNGPASCATDFDFATCLSSSCILSCHLLTLIVLHKYTHVKPAALPYLRMTAAAVLNKSVELDWN